MEGFLDIVRIIAAVTLPFACYYFVRAYKKSKSLLPEEVGAVPFYTEQAGGRFGEINWTIPFVRVSCYRNFTAVHAWNCRFVLKPGDVLLVKKEGFVADGIRVVHKRCDLPDEFIIWPRDITKLMAAVEKSLHSPERTVEQTVKRRGFPLKSTKVR